MPITSSMRTLETQREKEKAIWLPEELVNKLMSLARLKENATVKDYVKGVLEEHVSQYNEVFKMIESIED